MMDMKVNEQAEFEKFQARVIYLEDRMQRAERILAAVREWAEKNKNAPGGYGLAVIEALELLDKSDTIDTEGVKGGTRGSTDE